MFYLVGLGLGDVKDITVKGLEIVRACSRVYLEAYTSVLCHGPTTEELAKFYGREVLVADRKLVEENIDELLDAAASEDVALLVVGDPFGATTHGDLMLRAREKGVGVRVVHNASIMNAVGCSGLQLYSFGETVSVVFWTADWQPDSYYDKILSNRRRGLHTLCLLDIKVKEQTVENMMRGRQVFEPPKYMTAAAAATQLLQIAKRRRERDQGDGLTADSVCVALARIGWHDQKIVSATLSKLADVDMGPPLHSLIVCGQLHSVEEEILTMWLE